MRVVLRVLASLGAGVGMWSAFPDVSLWMMIVPSLATMLWLLDGVGLRGAFFYGFLFGAAFWLPHVQWAQISAGGGPLPWIALALTQILFWALWAWAVSLVTRLSWVRSLWGYPVAMALLWVGVEQLRARVPFSGFPWGNIAYPHVDAPLGHVAVLGGETLVSFLVVVVAALLRLSFAKSSLFTGFEAGESRRLLTAFGAILIYILPMVLPLPSAREQGSVTIGSVQGGIEVPGIETYRIEGKVTQNHVDQTERLLAQGHDLDVIVWGEGALDRDPRTSDVVSGKVSAISKKSALPILVGFTEYDREAQVVRNRYGLWSVEEGLSPALYGKQIPVPFGEYIPFRSLISALATEAAQVSVDMEAVANSARYDVTLPDGRSIPFGVGICFEVAYESLWQEAVRSGAQVLLTPSNNYHFRSSAEPAQQAQMARFRALEYSRSMVQVSTTGESVMVRPDGGVQAVSVRHASDVLVAELPLRDSFSLATYTALPLAWAAMIGMGVLLLDALGTSLHHALARRGGRTKRGKTYCSNCVKSKGS